MPPADVLIRTVEGPVVTLRINRPEHENRLNRAVLGRLRDELVSAELDDGCRAVVITGTGETFCCGGDVAEMAAGDSSSRRAFGRQFGDAHAAIVDMSKPVLAAVNGDARAGGLSLLAICDLAVARRTVRFAMPEIRDGLWPVMAMVSLCRVLPHKRAFELYYFGEDFGVDEALGFDLINRAVGDGDFDATVRDWALRLAGLPVAAVRIGRSAYFGVEERTIYDGYEYSADCLIELLEDPETEAALKSRGESPEEVE